MFSGDFGYFFRVVGLEFDLDRSVFGSHAGELWEMRLKSTGECEGDNLNFQIHFWLIHDNCCSGFDLRADWDEQTNKLSNLGLALRQYFIIV